MCAVLLNHSPCAVSSDPFCKIQSEGATVPEQLLVLTQACPDDFKAPGVRIRFSRLDLRKLATLCNRTPSPSSPWPRSPASLWSSCLPRGKSRPPVAEKTMMTRTSGWSVIVWRLLRRYLVCRCVVWRFAIRLFELLVLVLSICLLYVDWLAPSCVVYVVPHR